MKVHSVRILSGDGNPSSELDIEKDILIQMSYWNLRPGAQLYSALHLRDKMGAFVLSSSNMPSASLTPDYWWNRPHPVGLFQSVCRIPGNLLNEGNYTVSAIAGTKASQTEVKLEDIVSFHVLDTGSMRKEFGGNWMGVVRPRLGWQTDKIE